jgi:hypothetical protein
MKSLQRLNLELHRRFSSKQIDEDDTRAPAEIAGLLTELGQYPRRRSDLRPTRLGNALQSIEEYGPLTFGLDPKLFRTEMLALVSAELRDSRREASAMLDLLVALQVAAGLLCSTAVVGAIYKSDAGLGWAAVAAAVVGFACHRLVRDALPRLLEAERAVVDMARRPLATAWGLDLPASFKREREMWQALARYVITGDPEPLEPFRRLSRGS